jgi:hypothetical protein
MWTVPKVPASKSEWRDAGKFSRFKRVLEAARKEGYYKVSPAENLSCKSKSNKKVKEILESDEYAKLVNTPCLNHEVKKAFVFEPAIRFHSMHFTGTQQRVQHGTSLSRFMGSAEQVVFSSYSYRADGVLYGVVIDVQHSVFCITG